MNRLSLRTRLVAMFATLLMVGLAATGIAAYTLLERSLVAQLDTQLTAALPRLLGQVTSGLPPSNEADDGLPSDYHVTFSAPSGEPRARWAANADGDFPDVPRLTVQEVADLDARGFTVRSTSGTGRWRVVARPVAATATGRVVGSVAVGLPMTAADATLAQMRTVLLAVAAVVVGVGAVAGWWGVRRSFRSLRQIEDTAAAIAAGDLSRRVPPGPPSTEVGRLAEALNGMLTQIERAFADRTASEQRMRRFVADASHELRTPLATIRGYGELYRMGALTSPDDVAATLRRIEESASRMGSLVEDLLQLARLDEGRPVRRTPVDLSGLAAESAADLRALDPTRPVRLTVEPDADDVVVPGDPDRLRQVLANLVGNVVQHTPAGTPVELAVGIRTDDAGTRAWLEVRDHGPGISPEHAARVFERFYRVDAARGRQSGGAGLGMAIVAAIVAAHSGEVELEQTPGGGTTVRVLLPVRDYDDQSRPRDDEARRWASPTHPSG